MSYFQYENKMFPTATYVERRSVLKQHIGSGLLLFIGNELSPINFRDNSHPFRQDSSFLYYFGLSRPSLFALIDIDNNREIVFGDDPSIDSIIWTGNLPTIQQEATYAGITDTRPLNALKRYVKKAIDSKQNILYLPPYREEHISILCHLTDNNPDILMASVSKTFIRAIIAQREIKTEEEIAEIEKAVDLSVDMHREAICSVKPGMTEAQVAAEVHSTALAAGSELAFRTIATVNGQILHNYYHGNTLKEGDLFLLDAGAETPMGYAGDLSSSFPVSTGFTPQQKEIYQITLDAHNAAAEALRPGVKFREIHRIACRTLILGLQQIGMMKGDTEGALSAGAHALFFPCGTGHMMGLDVHDMESLGEEYVGYENEKRSAQFGLRSLRLAKKLKAGFVHTIEPGIYFIPQLIDLWKSKKINAEFLNFNFINKYRDFGGIRNEENFVITSDGNHKLGKTFSKEISEIEAMRASNF